jgi:hypothetical protein
VLEVGHSVDAKPGVVNSESIEVLALALSLAAPVARIANNPTYNFNITTAVARFVWMIAGSDRLEDIAFYEPRVRNYSDNNISVPGSSYGMRLFQPHPGLNQIEAVTQRLLTDRTSRRAAAVIWCPDDAVRISRDIPCAFGTFFHIRNGQLLTTHIMRSNNAVTLLPFNVFEFTLLGEMVARTVGAELGPFVLFAGSMHVFLRDRSRAEQIVLAYKTNKVKSKMMPRMPADPEPLAQGQRLVQLEAKMRHSFREATAKDLLSEAAGELHPYWLALYHVLLAHALLQSSELEVASEIAERLPEHFRPSVDLAIAAGRAKAPEHRVTGEALQLELGIGLGKASTETFEVFRREFADQTSGELLSVLDELAQHCNAINQNSSPPISISEFTALSREFLARLPVAARADGEAIAEGRPAHRRLSRAEVLAELRRIRRGL